MNFLKTTAVGGLVFLIPLVVVAAIIGKGLQLVRGVLLTIEAKVPYITLSDVLLLNLIAIVALFLLCFLAGLIARSSAGQRVGSKLDGWLLATLPGYSVVKGLTEGMRSGEEQSHTLSPVLATLDDNAQLAFEVERSEDGIVVVFLPGCPDAWAGSVVYLDAERVRPLSISVGEAMRKIRAFGRGSATLAG